MYTHRQSFYETASRATASIEANATPLKTALFVDFENIYRALKVSIPKAAERFATAPAHWLEWITRAMSTREAEDQIADQQRLVLLRRCYLNPGIAAHSRSYFVRAAFSVIDCPSLAGNGKNSSDIQMVMDILDTLEHKTYFDEFIILSGDSDFTPVLLRLRAHARRTAILSIGPASEAYRAAADHIIDRDHFIESALESSQRPSNLRLVEGSTSPHASDPTSSIGKEPTVVATQLDSVPTRTTASSSSHETGIVQLDKLKTEVITFVFETVTNAPGQVAMATVASQIGARFGPHVKATNWFTFGSFKAFVQQSVAGVEVVTGPGTPGHLRNIVRHTPSSTTSDSTLS